jgi:hypothetical protein
LNNFCPSHALPKYLCPYIDITPEIFRPHAFLPGVELFLAVFGDKYNMILAFPFHMSHTLPIFHCGLLLVDPFGAFLTRTLLFDISGSAKPFQVSRPKAVFYFRK